MEEWSSYFLRFIEAFVIPKIKSKSVFYKFLSCNPNITLKTIEDNPDIPWDFNFVSCHPKLTLEFVKKNHGQLWNWNMISCCEGITFDVIKNNPNEPWVPKFVCMNPNVNFDIVAANPCFPWDWKWLSCSVNLTNEVIQNNLDKPWVWQYFLSENCKKFFIEITSLIPWNWGINSTVDFSFVIEHFSNRPLNWEGVENNEIELSILQRISQKKLFNFNANDHVSVEIIKNNKDILQKYNFHEEQSNMAIESIKDNIDLFTDPWYIGGNDFEKDRDDYFKEKHKKTMREVLMELLEIIYQPDNYDHIKEFLLLTELTIHLTKHMQINRAIR